MDNTRKQLYQQLEQTIGNTPLVLYPQKLSNGNQLFIKEECRNPFGSHYDRVYLELFQQFENSGKIKQGDKVLETTSGTAGVSFAGIGKLLGFDCHVAIPLGVDQVIIEEIRKQGAELYFTPEKDYVSGFPLFLIQFLSEHKGEFIFLNHSMGKRSGSAYLNNPLTLVALRKIGEEVVQQMKNGVQNKMQNGYDLTVDYFLPAVGNGSTILGPAPAFEGLSTKIIAYESFQAAVVYDLLQPEKYQQEYGIAPGSLPRHKLRGTSYQGIDFPHIRNAVAQQLIFDSVLVSDREIDANYFAATGRNDTLQLPHWDDQVFEELQLEYGRSTRAGIAVAQQLSKKVEGKNFVIMAYDTIERYDVWEK